VALGIVYVFLLKIQESGHALDSQFIDWVDFCYFSYFFENEIKICVTKAIESLVVNAGYLIR
jgi:hypothetical protein